MQNLTEEQQAGLLQFEKESNERIARVKLKWEAPSEGKRKAMEFREKRKQAFDYKYGVGNWRYINGELIIENKK